MIDKKLNKVVYKHSRKNAYSMLECISSGQEALLVLSVLKHYDVHKCRNVLNNSILGNSGRF